MSDVRIMKKIIIQIYNNLQVLWSSKVRSFHFLSCWDDPSLGPSLVFSLLQGLLSHLLRVYCLTFSGEGPSMVWTLPGASDVV